MSIGFESRKIDLYLPIIAAPMDTVCENDAALVMAQYGGLGIIHRFAKDAEQNWHVNEVASRKFMVGAAVGVSGTESVLPKVESLIISGAKVILVDAANGHNVLTVNTVREIRRAFPDVHIMSGNVSTWDGFLTLSAAGADSIRVGIGGGSMCTTRIATGHGMPTLSSIMEVYEMQERLNLPTSIIADGGIRYSGDMVKALVAGANTIMAGGLFAGTEESPGETTFYDGRKVKSYRGMGSIEAMKEGSKDRYFQDAEDEVAKLVPEGIVGTVSYKGHLSEVIYQLVGGLKAGMGYCGSANMDHLQTANFVRITNAGMRESHPHDISITREAPNYSR
jgi:IMP dehydrogenase